MFLRQNIAGVKQIEDQIFEWETVNFNVREVTEFVWYVPILPMP